MFLSGKNDDFVRMYGGSGKKFLAPIFRASLW